MDSLIERRDRFVKVEEPDYLKFNILTSGVLKFWNGNSDATSKTIQYRKNSGSWTNWTAGKYRGSSGEISVLPGDVIEIKGSIWPGSTSYAGNGHYFYKSDSAQNATFTVSGKIASITGDINRATIPQEYGLAGLFYYCYGLISAEDLILPIPVGSACYSSLFLGCSNLVTPPPVLHTTISTNCYNSMFKNCTSLTSAPELPATTLANDCYVNMFIGCKKLTRAPDLPALSPATTSYSGMFTDCSTLSYIKCLLTTGTTNSKLLRDWMSGVATNGTFVRYSGVNWQRGVSGVPYNWTILNA